MVVTRATLVFTHSPKHHRRNVRVEPQSPSEVHVRVHSLQAVWPLPVYHSTEMQRALRAEPDVRLRGLGVCRDAHRRRHVPALPGRLGRDDR